MSVHYNLPEVAGIPYKVPATLEEALAQNLDKEGLIRLKAVEKTIEFYMGKNPDEKTFQKTLEQIYNALTLLSNGKSERD